MAIESSNSMKPNKLSTLTAIRAAESAGYLTVGSKKYLAGQLAGKRNGQTYDFVIKDAGSVSNSKTASASAISERVVSLSLEPWNVAVSTNYVESITDMDWDSEIAEPNGQKLAQGITKKAVAEDLGKCGVAFAGSGFAPLSMASAHLASVTNEDLYGFVDPNIEAILTSNGQQFVPVSAPDMYSKGLLGKFHGAEYRAQRFMKSVVISQDLVDEIAEATVTSFTVGDDGTSTLLLNGVTEAIPAGTVIWVEGVMACDTVGDATAQEHAFVAIEAASNGSVKVRSVDMSGNGTRDICDADETAMTAVKFANRKVSIPDAGRYYCGIIRANGAFEFETLDTIEAKGAEYQKQSVQGITVHQNQIVNLSDMTNLTRWDIVSVAGIVEPRAVAYVLIK